MDSSSTGIFPSQAVSSGEKASSAYGLSIAKAIESEWFKRDSGSTKYYANRDNFHRLRLYARGEQSIQKYKDELKNIRYKSIFARSCICAKKNRVYGVYFKRHAYC